MVYTGSLSEQEKKWQLQFRRRVEENESRGGFQTAFLDPRQLELAEAVLAKQSAFKHTAYGGYDRAERNVIHVFPAEWQESLPRLKAVMISFGDSDPQPGHRDLLGAVLGVGLRRDQVGDILLFPGGGAVIVAADKAPFICSNLARVGSAAVSCAEVEPSQLPLGEGDGKQVRGTVASLRADSVLSLGFGMPRSRAATLLKSGVVRVNWRFVDSPSLQLAEGDQLSIKGRGRLMVEKVEGETRRGRTRLTLKKYS